MKTLTPKQLLFVEEYLVDLNATAAYKRAGYKGEGRSAENAASHLLGNVGVKEAIAEAIQARSQRVGMQADDVLNELKTLGRSSILDYQIDDHGHVVLAEGAPAEAIRAVSSIKRKVRTMTIGEVTTSEYETEIKLWSKPAALKMAGEHHKLFIQKHEHSGPNGKAIAFVEVATPAGRDSDEQPG